MIYNVNVQRLSLDEGVKPQANGGRKISLLYFIGWTYSLVTFCNGSAWN